MSIGKVEYIKDKNEGNMTISGVDNEVISIDDALLALRMTEDALIWFYKTSLS